MSRRTATPSFFRAHIPGARFFDIDQIADPDTDLPHMVPTPGRFAKLMARARVSATTSRLVFYDQKGLASAARGWWLMGLFGHDNAAVLDGGLPKWMQEGRPVQDGEPRPPAPTDVPPRLPRGAASRCRGHAAQRADGRELVLDARAAGRFTGAVPEPRAGMRSGHIPGSVSLPYTDLLQPDGTFRPAGEVREPLRGRRGGWLPPAGDELRLGRHRLHPDAGAARRRFPRRRGV